LNDNTFIIKHLSNKLKKKEKKRLTRSISMMNVREIEKKIFKACTSKITVKEEEEEKRLG